MTDHTIKFEPRLMQLAAELSNKPVPPTSRSSMPEPTPKLFAGIEYDPELNCTTVIVNVTKAFQFNGTPAGARQEAAVARKYAELLDKMANVAKPNG